MSESISAFLFFLGFGFIGLLAIALCWLYAVIKNSKKFKIETKIR